VDLGWTSAEPSALFRTTKARSAGLVVRTMAARFYVELAYGWMQTQAPGEDWGRSHGSLYVLVGTRPFDLWKR
jgi:hypothetical protein